MRRSIWGPVAVCVLALVASAVLPHADVRTWSAPVAGVPARALARPASSWFAPSWPVPALRHTPQPDAADWRAAFAPSWPVPALRAGATASHPRPHVAHRAAGPIERERVLLRARTLVSLLLAVVIAAFVTALPLWRGRPVARRRGSVRRTVTQLAERGVAQSRIAAEARLPRDAVRVLLRQSEQEPLRRRS